MNDTIFNYIALFQYSGTALRKRLRSRLLPARSPASTLVEDRSHE